MLFEAVTEAVAGSSVEVIDDPSNINDPDLARRAADQLHILISGSARDGPQRPPWPGYMPRSTPVVLLSGPARVPEFLRRR